MVIFEISSWLLQFFRGLSLFSIHKFCVCAYKKHKFSLYNSRPIISSLHFHWSLTAFFQNQSFVTTWFILPALNRLKALFQMSEQWENVSHREWKDWIFLLGKCFQNKLQCCFHASCKMHKENLWASFAWNSFEKSKRVHPAYPRLA